MFIININETDLRILWIVAFLAFYFLMLFIKFIELKFGGKYQLLSARVYPLKT